MKYLITESQLDKSVFKYLDTQNFIRIRKRGWINFVKSRDDEFAKIRYDERASWCYINYDLITEISSFFSLGESDSEELIGKCVENTLQSKFANSIDILNLPRHKFRVTTTYVPFGFRYDWLKIPK
jgi:hypothetical protein